MFKKVFSNYLVPFISKESLVINNGILSYKELIKKKYDISYLMSELKPKKINRIEDVEYAFLKSNGIISIYEKQELPIPIIVDGKINTFTLRLLHKNIEWINNIVIKENIDINNIFYAFYKDNKVYIIKK
jgi:uncharacterized membrane protein YcaP (DUF421 family)